ncbi:hypothetical protein BU23DRAFT_481279, partial [Bimuria novae-zelandiae CBS 107.79]
ISFFKKERILRSFKAIKILPLNLKVIFKRFKKLILEQDKRERSSLVFSKNISLNYRA